MIYATFLAKTDIENEISDDLEQKKPHESELSDSSVSIQYLTKRTTKKTKVSTSKTNADLKIQVTAKDPFEKKLHKIMNVSNKL